MAKRKKVLPKSVVEVLKRSRRRCCICFGLERDDKIKKGQIAHLDKNPQNNDFDNLAYICLNHHDDFDGTTSQSKSLQVEEVKQYRKELYESFAHWESVATTQQFLNFLSSRITLEDMVDAALEAGKRPAKYIYNNVRKGLTVCQATSPLDILCVLFLPVFRYAIY